MGLSEDLYRELDSMGSQVGVTVVCPEVAQTNITGTPTYRKAGRRVMSDFPLNSLTPQAIAEEIVHAVDTRRFRVLSETSPASAPPFKHFNLAARVYGRCHDNPIRIDVHER